MEGAAKYDTQDLNDISKSWMSVAAGNRCQVKQRILKEGNGAERAKVGSVCKIIIQSENSEEDTHEFLLPYPINQVTEVKIGEGECDVIEGCLEGMSLGEKCELLVRPLPTHTAAQSLSPPYDTHEYKYTVQMECFTCGKESWEMTFEEKWETALHHKEKGGERFQAGDIWGAADRYARAMRLLVTMQCLLPPTEASEYQQIKAMLHANLAACQLKLGQPHNALESATRALKLDSSLVKGLYRRAMAYMSLGEFDQARVDLKKLLELEPGSRSAVQALKDLDAKVKSENAQLARAMSKLFT
ncbi:FK506-binding protein-like [Polypterus senegalus]